MTRVDGYAPIGEYGLVGDGHACALVSLDGRIDWLAAPAVDTPPLLAAVIDAEAGGHFALAPAGEATATRRYLEGTNVIETTWRTDDGEVRVTDALTQGFQGRLPWTELARSVECSGGPVTLRWELRPGTRFASVRPWVHERDGLPFVLAGDLLGALVVDGLGEAEVGDGVVRGEAVLQPGSHGLLALVLSEGTPLQLPSPTDVRRRLDHTLHEWRAWSGLIGYDGPHSDVVVRSALAIKALASADSGALAAAPTTSLPEVIGKGRNFDYRYAWVRDASFMLDALARLGLTEEIASSLTWLLEAVKRTAPDVHTFYLLSGEPAPADQEELELLPGYRGSKPVILGNQAAGQAQFGAYGDLFGAVARYIGHGGRLDTETGLVLVKLADQLCDEWPLPGAGIWELGTARNYTSGLINSWTAVDRAARLARQGELPAIHAERWEETAAAIHRFVDERCWSEGKQSYTFYAGTDELDASVLLAARTGFLAGDDPRLLTTIDAIRRHLTAEGAMLYRYTGASEQEHAFVCCGFWMIEALCYAGRTDEAGELLDGALKTANDLGLWSEELDPATGELLGNMPLGLSHLSVIGAVTAYAAALEHGRTPSPIG